jgi:hypothetical protein
MTIRLRCNPQTGKKDIIISLSGDEDALPHEHEQQHRALVEKLIEGGLAKAGEIGEILREEDQGQGLPPVSTPPTPERQAQKQGG